MDGISKMNEPIRDLILERPLPSSPDTERAILGSVLLDNGLIDEAAQLLDIEAGSDFYVPSNRRVWMAMLELWRVGAEIDPLTLAEELRRDNALESVGGMPALSNLSDGLFRVSSIAQYVKIIRSKSLLRKLIKTANKIMAEALEEEEDAEVIASHAEQAIFEVRDRRHGKSVMSAKEIVRKGQEVLDGYRRGESPCLATPWEALNVLVRGGIYETELWGLLALIKQGKSAWMKQWAHMLVNSGKRVLIFSREMSEVKILFRMLAAETDIPASHIRFGIDDNRITQLVNASKRLENLGLFIDTKTSQVDEFRARTREMIRLEGIDIVFGDYLQLFKSGKKFDSRASEVGYVWRAMKDTAQDFETKVCALAQGSRESFKTERPFFHQAEGSGEAEKSVDVGMVLVTELNKGEPNQRPATLHIDYQRDEDAGTSCAMTFHGRTMEFSDLRLPQRTWA